MSAEAELIRLKLLRMGEQLEFLEYVWNLLQGAEQDHYLNNYKGKIPNKYK